jgi:cytochrome c biogenesis protein CcmG/thiol:disulfide interchange protein DsbE
MAAELGPEGLMSKQTLVWVSAVGTVLAVAVTACTVATPTPTPATPTLALVSQTLIPIPPLDSSPEGDASAQVPVKPQKGFQAPDFALPNLEGETVSLGDLRGQLVLVNFWATWCEPCRDELPAIQEVYQNSDDLVVLGVDLQEGIEDVKAFIEKEGLTFPILLDKDGHVSNMYRTRDLPTSFFLNADGIIGAVHIGPMTVANIEDYLTQTRGK